MLAVMLRSGISKSARIATSRLWPPPGVTVSVRHTAEPTKRLPWGSERSITASMSIRRNTDQALPASHTIELMFNIPADFPFGGIKDVPTILMKQAEQARGAPLAGLVVKVTPTFFLVGLQSGEGEAQHNIALLKERPCFDIPIVYANGRRAILAVEKGTPGERAFAEAFKTWGQ